MKRFSIFFTLTILLISFTNNSYAQELDAKGVELKSMFQKMIDESKNMETSALHDLSFEGDVSVEPVGEYYAVTLPYLTLNYADGAKFEIGLIAINAAPHENSDEWKMTFALPTPMNFINEKEEKSFQLNIGAQRASGVWNSTLGYFSKLDANYQNIVIDNEENTFQFSMPSVRAVYDLASDETGKWSGPVYFDLNNINLNIPEEGGEVLKIGHFGLNMEMFDYDPSSFNEYQEKLEKLIAKNEAQETPQAQDISELFENLLPMIGNGFTSEYSLKDLTINPGEKEDEFDTISLDSANMGLDLTGFLDNKVAFDLRLGYDGFDISPIPEDMPDLAPKTMNFDLSIQNIPFKEIMDMGKNSFEMAMSNPQMASMAGMSVLFKLPALLSQAGTSLVIDGNHFGNDLYHVSLDGKVVTDLQAANSATADITGTLKGLDAVVTSLNEQMQQNPDGGNTSFIQQILMGLTMAKGFAEMKTGENGEPIHFYKFIMNQQGQMLLNGQDMRALMGGGMQMQPGATSPQAQ